MLQKFKSSKSESNEVFKLKEIGLVIQKLLGDEFEHRFVQKPISLISTKITERMLADSVEFYIIIKKK